MFMYNHDTNTNEDLSMSQGYQQAGVKLDQNQLKLIIPISDLTAFSTLMFNLNTC